MKNSKMVLELRKRTLEELLNTMPVAVEWKGEEIMFALCKMNKMYQFNAYETMEGNMVYTDDFDNEPLLFESKDPTSCVAMMIGFLKYHKLLNP